MEFQAYFPIHSLEEVIIETISQKNVKTGEEENSQRVIIGKNSFFPYCGQSYAKIKGLKLCDGPESRIKNSANQGEPPFFDVAYEALTSEGKRLFVVGDSLVGVWEDVKLGSLDEAINYLNKSSAI
jgi:hypothetical protein